MLSSLHGHSRAVVGPGTGGWLGPFQQTDMGQFFRGQVVSYHSSARAAWSSSAISTKTSNSNGSSDAWLGLVLVRKASAEDHGTQGSHHSSQLSMMTAKAEHSKSCSNIPTIGREVAIARRTQERTANLSRLNACTTMSGPIRGGCAT